MAGGGQDRKGKQGKTRELKEGKVRKHSKRKKIRRGNTMMNDG